MIQRGMTRINSRMALALDVEGIIAMPLIASKFLIGMEI